MITESRRHVAGVPQLSTEIVSVLWISVLIALHGVPEYRLGVPWCRLGGGDYPYFAPLQTLLLCLGEVLHPSRHRVRPPNMCHTRADKAVSLALPESGLQHLPHTCRQQCRRESSPHTAAGAASNMLFARAGIQTVSRAQRDQALTIMHRATLNEFLNANLAYTT